MREDIYTGAVKKDCPKCKTLKARLLGMITWMKNIHPDQYDSIKKELK